MFHPVTENSTPVKLRIGFIVQNKIKNIEKLSSVVSNELYWSSINIHLFASVEVLSASEALNVISELDGLFISGKLKITGENISILPAEIDSQLDTLLQQAIINQLPVLSTSNSFSLMNHAAFANATLGCDKAIKSTLNERKVNTLSSLFVHPSQALENNVIDVTERNKTKLTRICGVKLQPNGVLAKMSSGNYYHKLHINEQELAALSSLLVVEAYTDDNVVAAFSLASKQSFYVAVNWKLEGNEQLLFFNQQLTKSFILACRKFKKVTAITAATDYKYLV
jgi:gamma-glutamyl-gamma-aminobutyrate hydrolase PuuD